MNYNYLNNLLNTTKSKENKVSDASLLRLNMGKKFSILNSQFSILFILFLTAILPNNLFAQCGTTTIVGTGTTTWVAPAGTTSVTVQAWGGGGGGGEGTGTWGAGGGGGGAYASSTVAVTASTTYTVIVGAGGASATNGGASSFGAGTVVAAGGSKGTLATTEGSATGKGPGGTVAASVGTIRYAGGSGGGSEKNDGGGGGGAGGSGGTGGNGGDGCIDCSSNAGGGTWGEGGTVGSGRGGRGGSDSPDSVAVCGFSPGGGGGGSEDESGELGAVGGSGQVILTYTSTACPSGVTMIYSGASQTFMTSVSSKTICTGTSVNIPLRSTAGTKFTWIAAANANVTGESTTVQTSTTINNTLTNTTSAVQTVTYTVIPVPTCNNTGVAQVLNVTVNPLPTMNSANAATICSGAAVNIPLTATTSTTTATTFSWIAANNANTSGESTTAQPTSTINNTIVNSSTSNQTVTYTVTPTNSCGAGTAQVVSVLVKAPPILSSSLAPTAVCSGTAFTYTATSTSSSPTFAWSRATVAGISNGASSGTGNVSETLINTTSASVNVTYVYTTTASDCAGSPQNVVVAVKPAPTLSSSLSPPAICSGTAFSYQATSATSGATFAWSRATVANITEAGTSGSSNPVSETLTNTTGVAINVTYTYTTTANSCSSVENVVVSVKASTKLSSSLTPPEICSATTFTYTATSATSGATFAWSRAAVTGISQALSSGTTYTVSETLTNTTAAAVNVTYVFTTTANSCSNSENVVVSVKPTAQLNSSLTGSVCSGSTFGYTATSASSPVTFAWTRAGVAGINTAAAGSGTGNISEVLSITTGTSAINTTYSYTTTLNGCAGATQNLVVTVNPIPVLSSTQAPTAICSGTTFTYTATSATSGATFAWSRAAVTGITEAATAGTGNVSETLTNTTTTAINVVYSYITTAASCGSAAQSVTVSVKPLPILNSTLAPTAICSGATFGYTATSATGAGAATFAWSRATVTGITEAGNSGSSNPISQVLTNTTSSAINVTYVYTTTFAGCSGASENVVVSVRPLPQGTFYGNTVCSSALTNTKLTFSSTSGTGPFDLAYDAPGPVAKTKTGAVSNTPFDSDPLQTVVGTYVYTLTSITDASGCVRTAGITDATADVIVTSGEITSDPATPAFSTTCAGTTASFYVNATGVQTYAWQVNTTGANGGTYDVNGTWTTIAASGTNPTYNGFTSATLVVTNTSTSHDGYRFRSVMTAACGPNVTSSIAKMTINTLPVLTSSLAPSPATCSGSTVVYTPTSGTAGATFAWTRAAVTGITTAAAASGTGAITTHTLTNTTVNPINVTYAYVTTNTVTTCSSAAENVVITINPSPVLSSSTGTVASMCSPAAFAYTPTSATIGATFAWTRATIAGITQAGTSGTAGISETLTNTTTAAINVTYTYTTTANTCSGPAENVVVTVNPAPVVSSTTNPADICTAVGNFTYTVTSATAGSTFAWTRATITGITEAGTSGTGNIAETLTNTTTAYIDVTYVYTVTANGCSNVSTPNMVVRVRPVPVLNTPLTQSACSAVNLTYTPGSATALATFAWTRATVANITPVGTSGTASANETLTNSTSSPINVIYVYTTTASGCSGPAQNVVVTVNPTPTVSSTATPSAVCSETAVAFAYTATSNVSGATFAWTRAALADINSNVAGSGTGNVSEVLTNTSTGPVTVRYVYTPTANGCVGTVKNVDVSIKPRPVLSSSAAADVCSGAAIGYSATSATGGGSATFAWSRAAVTGISNAAATGSANPIGETLNNTTSAPVDVSYIYTTTFDGCSSASANTVIITVIPAPVMTSASTATICTGNSLASVPLTFASDMPATYAWTRANTVSIGPAGPTSGSSNPVSEVLTNATADALSTTYVVTPTSNPGACAGTAQNVVVTVTPVPEQANAINANPN